MRLKPRNARKRAERTLVRQAPSYPKRCEAISLGQTEVRPTTFLNMTDPYCLKKCKLGREVENHLRLFCQEAGDVAGIEIAGLEIGIGKDALVQRNGGMNAFHHKSIQGSTHSGHGFRAVFAMDN